MRSLNRFRTRVNAKQTELILRDLSKKQEMGEIRSEEELRTELEQHLQRVASAGRITIEIPVRPWEKVESHRFKEFFDSLNMDIETLFVEVDHTEDVLEGLARNVSVYLRNLRFSLGNLRSEIVQRRLRATPGSGWSRIARDSFDRGYGKLLGRSELSIDLFYDDRLDESQGGEKVPIQADARVEGIGKKLTLPETGRGVVGFKQAQLLWEAGTTRGDLQVDNDIEIYRVIDRQPDTFWVHTVGNELPLLGSGVAEVTQIAGYTLSGNSVTIDTSGLQDHQFHEYYFRITGFSGTYPQYVCMGEVSDYRGPICQHDLSYRCGFNYDQQYSQNCANKNCARYSPRLLAISGFEGPLEDGYGWDTGADITFAHLSGIRAGQTWRVNVVPSGSQGAQMVLELTLSRPSNINWIEMEPVATSPFQVTKVEYTKQGGTTRYPITDGNIEALDRIRLDFTTVEAEKIYLTILQETFNKADLQLRPRQQAIRKIDDFITRDNKPSIDEFYEVELEDLMADYLPNGPMRNAVMRRSTKSQEVKGHFYSVGFFEIDCGLTSYADSAVAVAKDIRVITPRMIGIQPNLEPGITYASGLAPGGNGTIELSAVKFNYDENNALINIDDIPIPYMSSGIVQERLFVDSTGVGNLRFAAGSISGIYVVNDSRYIDTDYWDSEDIYTPVKKTQVTLTDPKLTEDSILVIHYRPAFGVYLNEGKTVSIEDNREKTLSLSEVPALIVASERTANRVISYSDIYMRVIMRRNDLDIYSSPGLRDYQLLISEGDDGRFF